MPSETEDKPQRIQRLFKGEVDDVDKAKRTVTSIITTDAIDRYKEVVVARGISLDSFRENPVVLWCHNPTVVIAKNLWIKRFTKDGRSGLIAKTLFAKTEKALEVFELYAEGFLNGWSIGAYPDYAAYGPPTEAEIKARPELKNCRCLFRKAELVEYSACSIPANPEALGNEVGKSISADLRREIEQAERWETPDEIEKEATLPPLPAKLPPLIGRTFEQAMADTRAMVARMTGPDAVERAVRDTIDRAKGRV